MTIVLGIKVMLAAAAGALFGYLGGAQLQIPPLITAAIFAVVLGVMARRLFTEERE